MPQSPELRRSRAAWRPFWPLLRTGQPDFFIPAGPQLRRSLEPLQTRDLFPQRRVLRLQHCNILNQLRYQPLEVGKRQTLYIWSRITRVRIESQFKQKRGTPKIIQCPIFYPSYVNRLYIFEIERIHSFRYGDPSFPFFCDATVRGAARPAGRAARRGALENASQVTPPTTDPG